MEHNIHRESNQSVCLTVMLLFRLQFGTTNCLQAIQIVTILNIWGATHLWEQFILVRHYVIGKFHVARTIDYIPPPSSLYPLSTYWRSRESQNIVHGCPSTWAWTMQVQDYVPHCTLSVCNSYVMCFCTSPPVHSIAYTVSSSISVTVSAALLAIALCKSDKLA